ncbi:hypothetical protein GCM10023093_05980 [Nemorincola caseinilytica]|uniref:Lipoprotein n=1 Tax=Nemorincola caseinilytica TaxID=2054315 RepID=A0ABP8N4X3_9BACT
MKRMLFLALCAIFTVGLFSCKKTYVCKCTSYGTNYYSRTTNYDLWEMNRKTANYRCKERTYKPQGAKAYTECKLIE